MFGHLRAGTIGICSCRDLNGVDDEHLEPTCHRVTMRRSVKATERHECHAGTLRGAVSTHILMRLSDGSLFPVHSLYSLFRSFLLRESHGHCLPARGALVWAFMLLLATRAAAGA